MTAAVNATTSVPSTTEAAPPSVYLRATLEKLFVPEFTNRSSEEFRRLEATVIRFCDGIYVTRFGSRFIRTVLIRFSQAPGNGSTSNTTAEVRLDFNSSVPSAQLPTSDDVARVLVDAVSNPNSTLNVSILPDSVQVTGSKLTGATTATARMTAAVNATTSVPSTTEAAPPSVYLRATLDEVFVPEFTNRSSEEFRRLEATVIRFCDGIYVTRFGSHFIRTVLIRFSQAPGNGSTSNTTAEVRLDFNSSVPSAQLPTSDDVARVLVDAVSNPNSTLNVSILPDSVQVTGSKLTGATTATARMTAAVNATTSVPSTTEAAPPSVYLRATLDEVFVPEFTNRSSEEFRRLEATVIRFCDGIYVTRFGSHFIRTVLIRFSQAPGNGSTSNTTAEVRLDFNSSVPSAQLPTSDDVARVLVDAVSNPNSTLNVSILPDSVQVTGSKLTGATTATARMTAAVNATTSVPSTTEAAPPSVYLRATLEKLFVPEFTNRSSEEFRRLEATVIRFCDGIYVTRFGSRFIRTVLIRFSQAPGNSSTSNTTAEVRLDFNSSVPSAQLPTSDDVARVLVDAVSNPNSTLNVSILPDSVQVTGSKLTGATTATARMTAEVNATTSVPSTTEAAPLSVYLRATLDEVFVPEFTNRSSEEFRSLEATVIRFCDGIYVTRFGSRFIRTVLIRFSQAPGNGSTSNTTAEVRLDFNSSVPSAQLPTSDDVARVLVDAVSNPNSTLNVSILPDSVQVTGSKLTGATTATARMTAAVNATTSVPSTTEAAPPSVYLRATLDEVFVPEFTNRSSEEFRSLEATVIRFCDGIYVTRFGSRFIRTVLIRFSQAPGNGSTSNTTAEVRLDFNSSVPSAQLPTSDDVARVLVDAVSNPNSTLNVSILPDSVQVTGSKLTGATTATARMTAAVNATTSVPSTTEAAPPSVYLRATLEKLFVPEFTNRSSEEFRRLEATVIRFCDGIYVTRFGSRFIRTVLIRFSQAPGNGSTSNTTAEVRLDFNSSVPSAQLPTSDDVARVLVDAVSNPNSTLNVSILPDSVQVTGSTIPGPTTTTHISTTNGRTTSDGSTSGVATTTFLSTTGGTTTTAAGSTATAGSTTTSRTTTTAGSTTSASTVISGTTAAVTTTTISTTTEVPTPVVVLGATLEEPFVEEYNDRNSEPFRRLEAVVVRACNSIYFAQYDFLFIRAFVIRFRSVARFTITNVTAVEVGLEFNRSATPAELPTSAAILQTFVRAVSTPNTFNLSVQTNTVQVLQSNIANLTTTSPAVNTTTTATSAATIASSAATTATSAATTASSAATTASSAATTATSAATTASNAATTAFNAATTASSAATTASSAATTATSAATTASSAATTASNAATTAFNAATTASSAATTASSAATTASSAATTAFNAATTASSAATTASSAATTASSAATTASSAATTASSAAATTPTTEALVTRQLSFRSVGETFTTDLLNSSSEAFTRRASLLTSTLTPFYQAEFPSFRSCIVDSFSNGSIINNATLRFASMSVPNNTAIRNVLISAASNVTAFNIDTSSIFVENTEVSGGVSHKMSLATASCLVLLSWLLSCQQ
ncbi:uncharacterized protein LOC118470365 [Amphiprion ocellaris]|uniref:uncharacterized protein LOC118470365 n=1 Tax=Amphiprion ocellaris TaxID=80972 RepID=UPI0024115315|nr:uncharacterized protein LOC118470365 [Amphiprion ocellaris]